MSKLKLRNDAQKAVPKVSAVEPQTLDARVIEAAEACIKDATGGYYEFKSPTQFARLVQVTNIVALRERLAALQAAPKAQTVDEGEA